MKNKCKGSGRLGKVTTVYSYESVDGKRHDFINCPVCDRQFKARNDFTPAHVNFEDRDAEHSGADDKANRQAEADAMDTFGNFADDPNPTYLR